MFLGSSLGLSSQAIFQLQSHDWNVVWFWGMFTKLWIATISLVMPVLLFPWNNLAHTEWNFMIFYWEFFQSLSGKNSSLTSIKGNGYIMKSCIFMVKSHWIHFRMKYVLDKLLEGVKAHNMLSNIFPNTVPFVK